MDRGTRIARVADKISVVTSQIFRCQGLDRVSSRADHLGLHDLFYWIVFLSIISAWFFFLFMPERERLLSLSGRKHTLEVHLREENKELHRLQRGIRALLANDATAWERAARGKLGWVEPGELTDATILKHCHVSPLPPVAPYVDANGRPIPPKDLSGTPPSPNYPTSPNSPTPTTPTIYQRPSMPTLPVAPEALRTAGLRLDAALPLEETQAAAKRKLPPAPLPPALPSVPSNMAGNARSGTGAGNGGLHLNLGRPSSAEITTPSHAPSVHTPPPVPLPASTRTSAHPHPVSVTAPASKIHSRD